jgi:hypothetical protein
MVANPVFKAGVKIVKLRKGKQYVENVDEWEKSLKNVLSAGQLGLFLEPESGVQVPEGQFDAVWMQELCNQHVYAHRTLLAKREKINNTVPIKLEQGTPTPQKKGPITPTPPSMSSSTTQTFERKKPEVGLLSKYEENIRKNSEKIAKMKIDRMKDENKSKGQKITLFCNPFSMCEPHERDEVNPKANIIVDDDDPHNVFKTTLAFELEDTALRADRLKVWELIYASVSAVVEKSLLNSVAVGNCYHLYSVVKNHLRIDKRSHVIDKISKDLKSLEKRPKELFITFRSRYEGILNDMKLWEYQKDDDELKYILKSALKSQCELTKKVYESVITSHGTGLSNTALLDKMESLMDDMERENEESRVKEKKEKKHKKKQDKQTEEAVALAVQVATAGNKGRGGGRGAGGRGGKGRGGKGSSNYDSDIHNVCLDFQKNKCSDDDCYFKHVKLSKEQKDRLEKKVEERKAENAKWLKNAECYACGEQGHIASNCPKAQNTKAQKPKKGKKTVRLADAKDSDLDQILGAISSSNSFTDAQVVLLAKQMGTALASAKKEKQE